MFYASVVIIFNEENKVLVLKRSPEVSTFPDHWCFPGGTAEKDEDPVDCLLRETFEETSLELDPESLVYFYTMKKEEEKDINFYITDVYEGEIELDWESSEHKWVEPSELREIEFIPSQDIIFDLVNNFAEIIKTAEEIL